MMSVIPTNRVRSGEDTRTSNVSPGATSAPSRGESILRCGSRLPSRPGGACAAIAGAADNTTASTRTQRAGDTDTSLYLMA